MNNWFAFCFNPTSIKKTCTDDTLRKYPQVSCGSRVKDARLSSPQIQNKGSKRYVHRV